ncbi:methyl-accepting chemotaxis protein [Halomicroarcula sp. GCM10025324]|uniref:methyl-accepting chemotaxis protein n=1 Tax=Haloarcula TaxID=2237 RepID=UPI0023E8D1B8|nr:methyl-accepting chemotaxis protein [Halomicroarcula sp. ZS-22-S1]
MTLHESDTVADAATAAGEERTVANAQGALAVVEAAASDVDDQLAAIDRRADEQVTDAQWVVEEISALSATIEEIAATTAEVDEQSDRAADEVSDGRGAAQDAIETMDEVRSVGQAVLEEVDALEDRIDHIASALEGIDRITDQTNMLALNASIEAARAGDGSDGFAVVADEIKQLAEESQAQADDIDDVLAAADVDRRARLADAPTLETGIAGLDTLCDGGLVVGGQAVLQYGAGTPVDHFLSQLCASAVASGLAVSLTPTPTLDRERLAAAFDATDVPLRRAMADDRLFVLDMFGTWREERNVFDIGRTSLSAANETTDARREVPLLVVGNIEGEVETAGEQAAREARYENDDGVFEATDTVLNVVATGAVPETLAAFYAGAADQELVLEASATGPSIELRSAPTGTTGVERSVTSLERPPFLRVATN